MSYDELQKDVLNRIRTIKGHLGGIEKMIEEKKDCEQILIQVSAVKAAIDRVGVAIIEKYTEECIFNAQNSPEELHKRVKEMIGTLVKFSK